MKCIDNKQLTIQVVIMAMKLVLMGMILRRYDDHWY